MYISIYIHHVSIYPINDTLYFVLSQLFLRLSIINIDIECSHQLRYDSQLRLTHSDWVVLVLYASYAGNMGMLLHWSKCGVIIYSEKHQGSGNIAFSQYHDNQTHKV